MEQHPTLEKMREAAERFKNRHTYRRPATTQEQSENVAKYWENVFQSKPKQTSKVVKALVQESDYKTFRKAFIFEMERRADEIAIITANPNFKWEWSEEQGAVIKKLIQWFINDPQCDIPLSKGPFLYGMPGTGKTEIVKALGVVASDLELSKRFEYICMSDEYEKARHNSQYDPITPNLFSNRCLDEFGRHFGAVKSYGNETDINESVIEGRYARFMSYGQNTIAVTNASPNELLNLFSPMVADRVRAMCAGLLMPGNSKR